MANLCWVYVKDVTFRRCEKGNFAFTRHQYHVLLSGFILPNKIIIHFVLFFSSLWFYITTYYTVMSYYLRPILLVFLSFCLSMFDHSSYSKNFGIIIYFVYHLLYYQKYFTYDLSFFIFALIFQIKWMVKRCK